MIGKKTIDDRAFSVAVDLESIDYALGVIADTNQENALCRAVAALRPALQRAQDRLEEITGDEWDE